MDKMILFRIFFVSLMFWGLTCTIKSPESPSFESNLAIPITTRSYYMWKLAEDEENLYADETNFGFTIQGELDTVFVADNLKQDDPLTDNGMFQIGTFKLDYSDTLVDSSNTLAKLWPPAVKNQGNEIPVLPFDFNISFENKIQPFSSRYEIIEIDSGFVFLQLSNHLGFPLGQPLTVTLGCWKNGFPIEIKTVVQENQIDSGADEILRFDLTGKELTNRLFFRIQGNSPGSGTRLVAIDSLQQKLMMQMFLGKIRAKLATGQIPVLPLEKSDWLYLTDETDQISMVESRFKKADLVLNVKSYLNLNSNFDLISNHFHDPQNSPLLIPINLPRRDSITITRPLDNWFLRADVSEGMAHPKIKILTNGYTEATGNRMETVSYKDSIVVEARIINAEMDYVRGTVNRLLIEMDSTTEKFEYDYELPDLKFRNTELQLNIYNRIAFPIELNLSFIGKREAQSVERYEFRRRVIEPAVVVAGEESAQEKVTTFTVSDNRFNNLLSVIPEYITINGSALVGNWGTIGQIRQDDFIYGNYTFRAPFDVSFEDTIVNLDTTYLNINPQNWSEPKPDYIGHEISADFTEKMLGGQFRAVIENHLPITAEAIIKIDSSITRIFSSPDVLIEKRLDLFAGATSESGRVIRASCDTLKFDLSTSELEHFKNATQKPKSLMILIQFKLSGTKGQYVKVFRDDYLSIKESYLIIRYLLNEK